MRTRFSILLLFLVLSWNSTVAAQQSETSSSAWAALVREEAEWFAEASLLEQEILQAMTTAQIRAFISGVSPSEIIINTGESLEIFLQRKGIDEFDISWYSISGGGTAASGGVFQLNGTVGQPAAAVMKGGEFALTGGFWAITKAGELFEDGFESGDKSSWSNAVGG